MQTASTTNHKAGWVPSVAPTHGVVMLNLEPTDLAALLRSCLEPFTAQVATHGIELRVDVMDHVPRVMVDREKIGWAVVTLVGNALRYVARHSEVVRGAGAGGSILVHLVHDPVANEVAIAVHDDGPGFPASKLPHLFVRRPNALHADGLALSLVREVVGAHDGRIEVESASDEEAHGTSITIRLRS